MKDILTENQKNIFLRHIPIAEHREVMRLHLNGESKVYISQKVGYSIRQVERIITNYWRNVCILLLQEKGA